MTALVSGAHGKPSRGCPDPSGARYQQKYAHSRPFGHVSLRVRTSQKHTLEAVRCVTSGRFRLFSFAATGSAPDGHIIRPGFSRLKSYSPTPVIAAGPGVRLARSDMQLCYSGMYRCLRVRMRGFGDTRGPCRGGIDRFRLFSFATTDSAPDEHIIRPGFDRLKSY